MSCGRTEEVAGDWWAGFVAGNGRVHLEEFMAPCVPVECILGFAIHTPISCTNVSGRMYVPYPFDVVSGRYGDNAHEN